MGWTVERGYGEGWGRHPYWLTLSLSPTQGTALGANPWVLPTQHQILGLRPHCSLPENVNNFWTPLTCHPPSDVGNWGLLQNTLKSSRPGSTSQVASTLRLPQQLLGAPLGAPGKQVIGRWKYKTLFWNFLDHLLNPSSFSRAGVPGLEVWERRIGQLWEVSSGLKASFCS